MRSESFQLSLENRVSVHHHGHADQIRRAQESPFRKLTMSQTYSIFNNLGCSLGGEGFPLRLLETTLHHLPVKGV
jgi:hypothetical protein